MAQVGGLKVRSLYRHMLTMARRIPQPGRRDAAVKRIRTEFRKHMNVKDDTKVAGLISKAQEHVSFLKIVSRRRSTELSSTGGKRRLVRAEDGSWVNAAELADSNSRKSTSGPGQHFGTVTSEHVQRANNLWRRQHFMDRR